MNITDILGVFGQFIVDIFPIALGMMLITMAVGLFFNAVRGRGIKL